MPAYRAADGIAFRELDVYDATSEATILRLMGEVVAIEAPVLLNVAGKRVGEAMGMGRVTGKAIDHMEGVLLRRSAGVQVAVTTDVSGERVLWRSSDQPSAWQQVRAPGRSPASQRKIHEVPLIELAAAVEFVLKQQISLPAKDLAREAARLLGVRSLGAKVKARMDDAIDRCMHDGRAVRHGEMVVLVG